MFNERKTKNENTKEKTVVCNKDCFNCQHEDCINDEIDFNELKEIESREKPVSKKKDRVYRRAYEKAYRQRQKTNTHSTVFEKGNEHLLEYWLKWKEERMRKHR